jgi:glyoxylase-like metal-dependent hydrolase (beta-lactamase superfamily II)
MVDQMFFRQLEVGAQAVFAYLIGDLQTREAVVVDPADNVDELIMLAKGNRLVIRDIINTHGHVDHVMGNAEMQEKTGAKIKIHEAEADYLHKIGDFWLRMFAARKSPPADETLVDGDRIRVGNYDWQVIHTPGHTPGGICLYNAPYGLCLTGDTLFVGSVGRVDGPKASGAQLLNSIQTKLLVLPDETEIFPGHNYGPAPTSTIGHERITNPFLNGAFAIDMF